MFEGKYDAKYSMNKFDACANYGGDFWRLEDYSFTEWYNLKLFLLISTCIYCVVFY